MLQSNRFLSPSQAARRLGLSPSRIRQLFDQGDLTGLFTPNGRIVDEVAVGQLAAERAMRAGRLIGPIGGAAA